MSTETASGFEQRVMRLERSARRLRGVSLVLALLVALLTAWQFLPGAPLVAARRFVLHDAANRERAELVTWGDGTVVLRLNGEDQKARALWRLNADGTIALRFTDRDGNGRVELRVEANGDPSLSLGGEGGRTRTWLGIAGDGGPALRSY